MRIMNPHHPKAVSMSIFEVLLFAIASSTAAAFVTTAVFNAHMVHGIPWLMQRVVLISNASGWLRKLGRIFVPVALILAPVGTLLAGMATWMLTLRVWLKARVAVASVFASMFQFLSALLSHFPASGSDATIADPAMHG